jgi:hypothetical protein
LESDGELKNKFIELYYRMTTFLIYESISQKIRSFIITHAPCNIEYLGKTDKDSKFKQQFIKINYDNDIKKQIPEQSEKQYYHIFGHLTLSELYFNRFNDYRICLDSGCVEGGSLSGIIMGINKPVVLSVASKCPLSDNKFISLGKSPVTIDDLDQEQKARLYHMINNKINFISGTIAPAPSRRSDPDIESLWEYLVMMKQLFTTHGQKCQRIIFEPKYMGSRCTIYLSLDLEKCYAISRNGFVIWKYDEEKKYKVNMKQIMISLQKKFVDWMKINKIQRIILDGELLPWSALGSKLIEKQFKCIGSAAHDNIQFLKQNGFDEALTKLMKEYKNEQKEFEIAKNKVKKNKMDPKFKSKHDTYRLLKSVIDNYNPLEKHEELINIYNKQLNIYGSDGELTFKPFSLLYIEFECGDVWVPTINIDSKYNKIIPTEGLIGEADIFKFVSDNDYNLVVDMNDFDIKVDMKDNKFYNRVLTFFNKLTTEKHMEGCVVKVHRLENNKIPFAMKIRNKDYLTIIYSYTYRLPHKYKELVNKKKIKKKLEVSIQEHLLGLQMLQHRLDTLTINNLDFIRIVKEFYKNEDAEKDIDPRL